MSEKHKKKHPLTIVYIEIFIMAVCFCLAFYLFYHNNALKDSINENREKIKEAETAVTEREAEYEKAVKEIDSLKDNDLEKEYELWLKRMDQLKAEID